MGMRVKTRDLGRRHGEYRHSAGLIILNPRLTAVQQRCTLAHELGHAHFGDTITDERIERRADQWAARLLVSPAAYARAESITGGSSAALARELGLTRQIVLAYRAYLRTQPIRTLPEASDIGSGE